MWRTIIAAGLLYSVSTGLAHAEGYKGCIVYEDDSFVCGTLLHEPDDSDDGYSAIDRQMPYIVGCIPDGICDSPDGMVGEGLDGLYSEVVFPFCYPVE